MSRSPIFLTAEWRWLVMLNYTIEPALLRPLVPAGTELDDWQGRSLISMVGFLFTHTRLCGLSIPWHTSFEEVNLRFYVRRHSPTGWRRAVVFVREIVPRPAIAGLARLIYNEPYIALPMHHSLTTRPDGRRTIRYTWRAADRWHELGASVTGQPAPLTPGSEAEFITQHYWGYTRQRDGGTIEYEVEHPPWRVWSADLSHLDCAVTHLYGPTFAASLAGPPSSAFVAEGSAVIVRQGRRLRPSELG